MIVIWQSSMAYYLVGLGIAPLKSFSDLSFSSLPWYAGGGRGVGVLPEFEGISAEQLEIDMKYFF